MARLADQEPSLSPPFAPRPAELPVVISFFWAYRSLAQRLHLVGPKTVRRGERRPASRGYSVMIGSLRRSQLTHLTARRAAWLAAFAGWPMAAILACSVQQEGEGPGHRQQNLALTPQQ